MGAITYTCPGAYTYPTSGAPDDSLERAYSTISSQSTSHSLPTMNLTCPKSWIFY